MNKAIILSLLLVSLIISSCEPDKDLITPDLELIQKVKSTEILLRNNTWKFNDLIVEVQYEMPAIPLLANVADANGMVQPGKYNSLDIFGSDKRQQSYTYQFSSTKINRDTTASSDYHKIGYYNVVSHSEIRLSPDSTFPVNYQYHYSDNSKIFTMKSDHLTNGKLNEAINGMIADAISSGKPDDIANAVIDKILGNENIHASIEQMLYDVIHGKVEEISQNPEQISHKLAELILHELKEVDWEALVYNKVLDILEELQIDDPQSVATELAKQIANRIATSISKSDIYDVFFPILQKFEDETLPTLVPVLAEAIYGVVEIAFSVENVYDKIYPLWTSFSEVDSSDIDEISDTLGSVITNHFFDAGDMAIALEPFIQTLRTTNTPKIPGLAQDIIDDVLIPLVDSLNASLPGLDLNPDWSSVKTVLTSALTVIKSSLNGQTNAEAAVAIAESIIGIMDAIVSGGIETTILMLQDIPADQASQVIAAWVNNLVVMAEPQVLGFLEDKLNEVVNLFNAEEIADELSAQIHAKILDIFGADNIYDLIYPLIEQLSEINIEAIAQKITDWLFDLGLVEDNITEEQILAAIAEVVGEMIGNINVDEASQKLVDLIMQSDIIVNIDGDILKQLIEIKTWELLIELGKYMNAIDKIEFGIIMKYN